MSTTNTVTSSTSATATTTATTASTAKETEDRFLKLLVTQMKNQDPLNPLDNAQVTSQMAQLSTVTELGKLNDAASAMSASFLANQAMQSAGLIGHEVVMDGSLLPLAGGVGKGILGLGQAADTVSVSIKNAAGTVVRTLSLGDQKAGMVNFDWDGKTDAGGVAPDGVYSFEVKASSGGQKVEASPYTLGKVESVVLNGTQGAQLNLAGIGSALLSDIRQVM